MGGCLPFLAEADGGVTLPLAVWASIGVGATTAIAWLARTWKASVDATNQQMVALVREVLGAVNSFTRAIENQTHILIDMQAHLERKS